MNVIKKIKSMLDDVTVIPQDMKYIKEKKEVTKALVDEANLALSPIQERLDEKLQELSILKNSIVLSTIQEFHIHLKDMKRKDNFGFSQEEFDSIVETLHISEMQVNDAVQSIDIVEKLNTQVTFIEKLNEELNRDEVDYYHSQALEYSRNIEDIVNNYSEIIRLIYNTIALIKRYTTECNKLNKQKDHIRQQIGDNYLSYTPKQKYLVQKHIYYTGKLLQLLNASVMNKDGSFNNDMINLLSVSNKFLHDAGENTFVNFEKKSSLWIYIATALTLMSIGTYLYYKLYYTLP